MSPQNYYARRTVRRRREVDLALMLELVRVERQQQSRLGVRKLYHLIAPELKAAGVKLGRDCEDRAQCLRIEDRKIEKGLCAIGQEISGGFQDFESY